MEKRPCRFRDDIARDYSIKRDVSEEEAKRRLEDFLKIIVNYLMTGYDVKINNFFNLFVRTRQPKPATNPVTKEPMTIPATSTIVAKMTKPLKDLVQGNVEWEG